MPYIISVFNCDLCSILWNQIDVGSATESLRFQQINTRTNTNYRSSLLESWSRYCTEATKMTPLSESEMKMVPSSENQLGKYQRRGRFTRKQVVIAVVLTALLAVVVGFIVGYFIPKSKPASSANNASSAYAREDVHEKLEDGVSAMKLEEEFRWINSRFYLTRCKYPGWDCILKTFRERSHV